MNAPPTRPPLPLALPAYLSAVLLWACYFPLACGPLAWVALVPWLVLVRAEASAVRRYAVATLSALLFFAAALHWVPVADRRMTFTWAGLALTCAGFWAVGLWLVRRLEAAGWPLVVSLPLVWAGLEYVRSFFATGFAWYYLGHTQHDFLPICQVADIGGAYLVSALVAAVNAALFEWLARVPAVARRFGLPEAPAVRPWRSSAAVALLAAAALGYGYWQLGHAEFRQGPRVAALQGNVDQRIRNSTWTPAPGATAEGMVKEYLDLCKQACAADPKPDLVVWPETSFIDNYYLLGEGLSAQEAPADWVSAVQRSATLPRNAASAFRTNQLLGLNTFTLHPGGRETRFNSALLATADGRVGGRYDKMHRVPFGEYVPLRWLPFMDSLAPYDFDYSIHEGRDFTRFPMRAANGDWSFGVIICYEDTDAPLAREYVRPGERPVDFLVTISNEGWFDGFAEHEEHLAISRFRSIECRRSLVRAVNMGVSAVIDPDGRVVQLPGPSWKESKKVAAVVAAGVPIDDRQSVYAWVGDWPWRVVWLAVGVQLVITGWIGSVRTPTVREGTQAPLPDGRGSDKASKPPAGGEP